MTNIEVKSNSKKEKINIYNSIDFQSMRKAGCLAAKTLDFITKYVQSGVMTEELDKLCHNFIVNNKAQPAPLNYNGFPKSICTSVNHVVCIICFAFILATSPTINILLVSPCHPSSITVTSIFIISPLSKIFFDGIP